MTQTFAVEITRTVVDSDPETYLDRTRFEQEDDACGFARAVSRYGHVLSAQVIEL